MAYQVKWTKCRSGDWCDLTNLDLSSMSGTGVYIIWHSGDPSRVVRIGQGVIADRLSEHRNNAKITKYGNLKVTWAVLPSHLLDGVERHLANVWNPLVGEAFPDADPIEVNSPFE